MLEYPGSGVTGAARVLYRIGNPNVDTWKFRDYLKRMLPIAAYRAQIIGLVRAQSAVIVTAETGAGKSTQVPAWLADEGYSVTCTQPRRLAARSLAQRVAEERGERLGDTIGVRTRDDRVVSARTRCVYATDGLALVRELAGDRSACLVIDEAHEWSINVETLIAWARRRLGSEPAFRLVVMSATIDAERLAAYLGGAPVVSVPGRLHPVEDATPHGSLVDDAERFLRAGRNVLVFQPGVAEIERTVTDIAARGVDADLVPLHGGLQPSEQARAFARTDRPRCVVATNVAQTSVTIDDIDVVIDSGMERRVEVEHGVEGLYLRPISRADAHQRRGRAGRTRPGVYVDHCATPIAERAEYPTAEILRSRLDQTVLRLKIAGIDAEALEFFHQPRHGDIAAAKQTLTAIGFLGCDGTVTERGRRAASLPVAPHVAAMVLEAERLKCVGDVLTIAALLETGGITSRGGAWRSLCAGETTSDALAQLAVFRAAAKMRAPARKDAGISERAYHAARATRRALADALVRARIHDTAPRAARREDILRAICAGMMSHVYIGEGARYRAHGGYGTERELDRDSVVYGTRLVVGLPWDLDVPSRRGGTVTRRLLRMVTAIEPSTLAEVAPHLRETCSGTRPRYDEQRDAVVSITETRVAGLAISSEVVEDSDHPSAAGCFAGWLDRAISGMPDCGHPAIVHARAVRDAARALNRRAGQEVSPLGDVGAMVNLVSGARSLREAAPLLQALQIDPGLIAQVDQDAPERITLAGHEIDVDYDGWYGPTVTVADRVALDLPDEITLPDGRSLWVATERWCPLPRSNVSELRRMVHEASESTLHDRFEASGVCIDVPSGMVDQPPIERREIGTSPVDGSPVISYGVVELDGERMHQTWWRSLERAQYRHEATRWAWAARQDGVAEGPLRDPTLMRPASLAMLQARFNRR